MRQGTHWDIAAAVGAQRHGEHAEVVRLGSPLRASRNAMVVRTGVVKADPSLPLRISLSGGIAEWHVN
jgi:hypothetical protein